MTTADVDAAIASFETWGRTVDNWVLICAAIVAIFLTAEVVFSVLHWRNENRLRPLRVQQAQFHETELGNLRKVAAEANAREKERLARLKLEVDMAWRVLNDGQRQEIIAALSPKPKLAYFIWVEGNPEAMSLMTQLADLFQKAHWHIGWAPRQFTDSFVANTLISGPDEEAVALVKSLFDKVGLIPAIGKPPAAAS
jgi:hypothetical protein